MPLVIRSRTLIILIVVITFLYVFWPREHRQQQCPPIRVENELNSELGPLIDAVRSTIITDNKGNQKVYLNAKGYITFLSVLRKQHHTMVHKLVKSAEWALGNNSVYSVTLKPQLPPSGDPHDYMSLGRYYWPDPTKPDGLPYIRKDGYPNPEFFSINDYLYLRKMFREVQNLGFAYFFTYEEKYVEKAMARLKEWFLDEKTKMNPNLNYAGYRKGEAFGWKAGVLDFHQVFRILQVIPLLRNSHLWDPEIEIGLKTWMTEYYSWLTTSTIGRAEGKSVNNHGTFYDVQALFLLDYLNRYDEAKTFVLQALQNRINDGILPTGQQHYETDRPTSWFYSVFNLQGLFLLAERADHYGVDGWHYEGPSGQSIKKAVDFLLPYALNDGKGWPVKNIKGFEMNDYVKLLELSYIIYGDDKYLEAIEELRPKTKAEQAVGSKMAHWEDNYLCNIALLSNRLLWTCLNKKMFILTVLRDTIHIQPYDFHKPKYEALTDEINRIYANKVIQEIGLCICLFDILSASEEVVHYGNGASYANVTFRLVVFRPFIGEILEGTVSSNTAEGVKVTLGYFDDILIPTNQDDKWKFDHETQVWVRLWDNIIPEEEWESVEDKYLYMYMDKDLPIRFRVIDEKFTDVGTKGPPPKRTGMKTSSSSTILSNKLIIPFNNTKQVPYELIGSIAERGLGATVWNWS
ncbi:8307_t:CDS:2 [Diversispora eburnea]|uniref:8307_t:CDS:1 n=1 Tax=Diversispora eburnea TaxID=1213867 RepID=A0A9N8YP68_9GLOM|nr:8307_t:CDS:2 [Diversispora eburnea]